eukprot:7631198-Prorocentrum_lima.AAC.1
MWWTKGRLKIVSPSSEQVFGDTVHSRREALQLNNEDETIAFKHGSMMAKWSMALHMRAMPKDDQPN